MHPTAKHLPLNCHPPQSLPWKSCLSFNKIYVPFILVPWNNHFLLFSLLPLFVLLWLQQTMYINWLIVSLMTKPSVFEYSLTRSNCFIIYIIDNRWDISQWIAQHLVYNIFDKCRQEKTICMKDLQIKL